MKTVRRLSLIVVQLLFAVIGHAQTVPSWKLQTARDSFTIKVRGEEVGYSVVAIEVMSDGACRVSENTAIGANVQQRTRIMVAGCERMATVEQSGTSRGQATSVDLHYTRGHVKGSAVTPGPEGTVSHVIDIDVPEHVVDVNLLQTVLSQLVWSQESDWLVPVFSAGKNGMTDMRVTVVGMETLETASGPVEAYKATMRGDVVNVELWVSRAAPHRVLKFVPVGSPMEMLHVEARALLRDLRAAVAGWLANLTVKLVLAALPV